MVQYDPWPSQVSPRSPHCLTIGHGWLPHTPVSVSEAGPSQVEPPRQILVLVAWPPPPHGTEQAPHSDHGEYSTRGAVQSFLWMQFPSWSSRKSGWQAHIPAVGADSSHVDWTRFISSAHVIRSAQVAQLYHIVFGSVQVLLDGRAQIDCKIF